jgi:hypothetical protein
MQTYETDQYIEVSYPVYYVQQWKYNLLSSGILEKGM